MHVRQKKIYAYKTWLEKPLKLLKTAKNCYPFDNFAYNLQ